MDSPPTKTHAQKESSVAHLHPLSLTVTQTHSLDLCSYFSRSFHYIRLMFASVATPAVLTQIPELVEMILFPSAYVDRALSDLF